MPASYIAFVDHRFSAAARREIAAALPDCHIAPYMVEGRAVLFRIESDGARAEERLNSCAFVDFAFHEDSSIQSHSTEGICGAIVRLAGCARFGSIRIEAKSVHARLGASAKSIEVAVGQRLEKMGVAVDLCNPKTILYLVLLPGSAIIGHTAPSATRDSIDVFRVANRSMGKVCRAWFKISEAVRFFGISIKPQMKALDIGAAPGGWADYLLSSGAAVLAVDSAALDYSRLCSGRKLLVLADGELPQAGGCDADIRPVCAAAGFCGYDAVHIKVSLRNGNAAAAIAKFGCFDILTVDTNTEPRESAAIAASLAGSLVGGAVLIMTLKLTTMSVRKHMKEVEDGLSGSYSSIRFKKLPHNRLELTVFAIRR